VLRSIGFTRTHTLATDVDVAEGFWIHLDVDASHQALVLYRDDGAICDAQDRSADRALEVNGVEGCRVVVRKLSACSLQLRF
jgi:hypothetical protein